MQANQKDVTPQLLNDQTFYEDLEKSLAKAREGLAKWIEDYPDLPGKSEMTALVKLGYDPKTGSVAVTSFKVKAPGLPDKTTLLSVVRDEANGDKVHIMCQAAGSTKSSPQQGRLCTDDGRRIDQETGEIMTEDATA
jgi:hypothetical protein